MKPASSGISALIARALLIGSAFVGTPALHADTASDATSLLTSPPIDLSAYAAAFVATQSFQVQSVVLPGSYQQASPSRSFDVSIYGSSQGLPGSVLGTVSNLSASEGDAVNLTSLGINAAAGETYWLVVTPNDAETTTSPASAAAAVISSSSLSVQDAVTAVPEPATIMLTGFVLFGFGLLRSGRRQ